MHEKIRTGMVGGGPGAGIGQSHRIAMRVDDRYELVAGVFSRDTEKSRQMGDELNLSPERVYSDYRQMAAAEADRDDGIACVAIVTPHNSHFEIARTFLEHGMHVVCDKPLTIDLEQARDLARVVADSGLVFGLTHNYSGYPMVRHAARLVRDGALGNVRLVQVEHAHGRVLVPQRLWRADPAIADEASVVFDLGTHAHHIVRFVTGLEITAVSAALDRIIPGREIYDNADVKLRLSNGAVGSLWASMAAIGHEHGLRVRIYGETGSIDWRHEDPQHLIVRDSRARTTILAQGQEDLSADAERRARVGLGHPEGFFAAFANLYSDIADAIDAYQRRDTWHAPELGCPTVADGVEGVRFVEAVKRSNEAGGVWIDVRSL